MRRDTQSSDCMDGIQRSHACLNSNSVGGILRPHAYRLSRSREADMSLGEHIGPYAGLASIRGFVATMYMPPLTTSSSVHALPALEPRAVLNALLRHPDHIFVVRMLMQATATAIGDNTTTRLTSL